MTSRLSLTEIVQEVLGLVVLAVFSTNSNAAI
jgi:hypothetical protein